MIKKKKNFEAIYMLQQLSYCQPNDRNLSEHSATTVFAMLMKCESIFR